MELSTENITWPRLAGNKFGYSTDKEKQKDEPSPQDKATYWVDVEDNRFINWMMPNTYPSAYKGWFRLKKNLPKGSYTFRVLNSMDVSKFDGEKFIGFEEYSMLGAKNYFTALVLIIISISSITFSIIFSKLLNSEKQLELQLFKKRVAGDSLYRDVTFNDKKDR